MKAILRARTGLLVATALVLGLLGPCLCGPAAEASQPDLHGCCPAETGLKLSAPGCCSGCATLEAPDSALLREAPPSAGLAPTASLGAPSLHRLAARPPAPSAPLAVLAPPTILRV